MLVILCGFSSISTNVALTHLRKVKKDFRFQGFSYNSKSFKRSSHSNYIEFFAERLVNLLSNKEDNFDLFVIICPNINFSERLYDTMQTSAMIYHVPSHLFEFDPVSRYDDELGNKIGSEISEVIVMISKDVKSIKDKLDKKSNCPWLLPLKNFGCSTLDSRFKRLCVQSFEDLGKIDDLYTEDYVVVQYGNREDGKRFARSPQSLCFSSPGRHEHGERRPDFFSSGHFPACWLAASYRLGIRHNSGFHFDVSEISKGTSIKKREFFSCHGDERAGVSRRTHANIYLNDFTR